MICIYVLAFKLKLFCSPLKVDKTLITCIKKIVILVFAIFIQIILGKLEDLFIHENCHNEYRPITCINKGFSFDLVRD